MINVTKNLKKILKYILMGLIVATALKYIPSNTLSGKEILMISGISSIGFSILDMISPNIKK
jgi:hypothetical protein